MARVVGAPTCADPQFLALRACAWRPLVGRRVVEHPALALVPIRPLLPLRAARPRRGRRAEGASARSGLRDFRRWWQVPVEGILFLFALTNAGVPLGGTGLATWVVLAAILVGKPLGITVSAVLATAGGLRLPEGIGPRDLVIDRPDRGDPGSPWRCSSPRPRSPPARCCKRRSWARCSACPRARLRPPPRG